MKRKYKRRVFVSLSFLAMGLILAFIFLEMRKSISFFCTTTELMSDTTGSLRNPVRVGGVVVKGSIKHHDGYVTFAITDLNTELQVIYSGMLPPLFGEGMGAIAKGTFKDGVFIAEELLAKHDEVYMPKKYTPSETRSGVESQR